MNRIITKEHDESASCVPISPKKLFKALIVSMLLTMVIFTVFALIITFTSISEASADTMVNIATAIATAVCGFAAARGVSSKGWLSGAAGGLLYIAAVWIIGAASGNGFVFTKDTAVSFLLAALIGAFGGIIGINTGAR